MSKAASPVLAAETSSRARRLLEGTASVAVWMTFGLVFHLSAYGYLLLGIPITIAFQRYVRRVPLRDMWVRTAPPFQLGRIGIAIAIFLMILPLIDLVSLLRSRASWVMDAWDLAAVAGAWAAAYALRYFRRKTIRELLFCLATAGVIGIAAFIAAFFVQTLASGASQQPIVPRVQFGLAAFLKYVPGVFLLEEVWFRGVLDSHLHLPGEKRGVLSAIYVSALWGLWHYPITAEPHRLDKLLATLAGLLLFHILIGVPLSWYWRRSGNLFVPGSVHALIDGVRDALVGLPV